MDRLNPLLERPGNATLLAEAPPHSDGSPQMFRASPDFRLFLTMDPGRGTISKALKNRVVEVTMSETFRATADTLSASVLAAGIPGPLAAVSALTMELDKEQKELRPRALPGSTKLPVLARVNVAHGIHWKKALIRASRLVYGNPSMHLIESALTTTWDISMSIPNRSVELLVMDPETFDAKLDVEGVKTLCSLDPDSEVPEYCDTLVTSFFEAINGSSAHFPATRSYGLSSSVRALARRLLLRHCCALTTATICEKDRVFRLRGLSELTARDEDVNNAIKTTIFALQKGKMRANAWICYAMSAIEEYQTTLNEIPVGNHVADTAKALAQLLTSSADHVAVEKLRCVAEIVGLIIDLVCSKKERTASNMAMFAVLFMLVKAKAPETWAQQLSSMETFVGLEDLSLTKMLGELSLPMPLSLSALQMEDNMVKVIRAHEDDVEMDFPLRKVLVEALCTVSSDSFSSPEVQLELGELRDDLQVRWKKARRNSVSKETPWSKLTEAASLSRSMDIVNNASEASAREALKAGLLSRSNSVVDLISLQRAVWGSASSPELELQCLRRLWRWGRNESPSASIVDRGPASALVFDSPLRMILMNYGTRYGLTRN